MAPEVISFKLRMLDQVKNTCHTVSVTFSNQHIPIVNVLKNNLLLVIYVHMPMSLSTHDRIPIQSFQVNLSVSGYRFFHISGVRSCHILFIVNGFDGINGINGLLNDLKSRLLLVAGLQKNNLNNAKNDEDNQCSHKSESMQFFSVNTFLNR